MAGNAETSRREQRHRIHAQTAPRHEKNSVPVRRRRFRHPHSVPAAGRRPAQRPQRESHFSQATPVAEAPLRTGAVQRLLLPTPAGRGGLRRAARRRRDDTSDERRGEDVGRPREGRPESRASHI